MLLWIFQLVKGIVHGVREYAILHRYAQAYKYIIFRLGFHLNIELLDLQVNAPRNGIDTGNFEIQARLADTVKFTQPLYDHGRLLFDGKGG